MPPFILRKYTVTFTHRSDPNTLHFVVKDIVAADVNDATAKAQNQLDRCVSRISDWVLTEVKVSG